MIWTRAVLALIVGLVLVSLQNASAKDVLPRKGNNSTAGGRPGNKTNMMLIPLADAFLYGHFACRNKQDGLRLPIAGSCVDYLICEQGTAERRTCGEGMHFSIRGLACLDARISKCMPAQMEIPCEGPCCTRANGLYPVEDGCSNFHICVDGQTHLRTCGSGLQFDADKLFCDIPERARCGTKIGKEVLKEESAEVVKVGETANDRPVMYKISHRVCKDKPDGYSVAIQGSCNKFYMCIGGLGYLKSCGKKQFNPVKHYCELKNRMFCPENDEDEVILDDDEHLPPKQQAKPLPGYSEDSSETDEEPQRVPHKRPQKEGKAKKPQKENNEKKPQKQGQKPSKTPQLSEESVEDNEEQQFPEAVRPGTRPFYPKPNEEEEEEEEELEGNETADDGQINVCADQPVGALLPLSSECDKYIRCRWDWFERRTAEVLTCPDNMHFNPRTKYCDFPRNVNCKASSSPRSRAFKTTKKSQKN